MRSIVRLLTTGFQVAMGAAAVIAAVVVIGFAVVMVALRVWRSDPPKAAIGGIRCHWHGRYLIARGTVLNFGGRDATFDVRPDIEVPGRGSLAPRDDDFISVRAGALRTWRWTDGDTGVAPGTAVSRCSATVFSPSRGEGESGD